VGIACECDLTLLIREAGASTPLYYPSDSTGTESSLRFIKDSLEDCLKNHAPCREASESKTAFMPARLLEISQDTLRLVEGTIVQGPYACLSQCWGKQGKRPLVTTHENLESHERGISLDSLPRVFREAVEISRTLGLTYLWIDSLCIVRDEEPTYWQTYLQTNSCRNSSELYEVFRHSHLTLVATSAHDADDKLFFDRGCSKAAVTPMSGEPTMVCFRRNDPGNHVYKSWREGVGFTHRPHPIIDQAYRPLLTRAWALQERLLSPRVVHFYHHELTWECYKCATCECADWNFPGGCYVAEVAEQKKSLFSLGGSDDIVEAWHFLVERYSALEMTDIKDRLEALSGLAKAFQEKSNDEYMAGLWRSSFVRDLAWRKSWGRMPPPPRTRISTRRTVEEPLWIAPTWSWASCNASVSFVYNIQPHEKNPSVVDSHLFPASANSRGELDILGQLRAGSVLLNGQLIRTKMVDSYTIPSGEDKYGDVIPLNSESFATVHFDSFIGDSPRWSYAKEHDGEGAASSVQVYCLVLGRTLEPHQRGWSVVLLQTDQDRNFYQRIGLAEHVGLGYYAFYQNRESSGTAVDHPESQALLDFEDWTNVEWTDAMTFTVL
jgi:hypothetical protein